MKAIKLFVLTAIVSLGSFASYANNCQGTGTDNDDAANNAAAKDQGSQSSSSPSGDNKDQRSPDAKKD